MKCSKLVLLFISLFCLGQNKGNGQQIIIDQKAHVFSKNDSLTITKRLPIIKVEPCLEKLFFAIVNSNNRQAKCFYGLTVRRLNGSNYIGVYQDQWRDATNRKYTVAIKIDNTLFLCQGNLKGSMLFHEVTAAPMLISFKSSKKPEVPVPLEPILQGVFYPCSPLHTYLEVYARNQIKGYKMKIPKRSLVEIYEAK